MISHTFQATILVGFHHYYNNNDDNIAAWSFYIRLVKIPQDGGLKLPYGTSGHMIETWLYCAYWLRVATHYSNTHPVGPVSLCSLSLVPAGAS